MFLGSNLGKESLNKEYKEFCIQTQLDNIYENKEVYNIIKQGKLDEKFNSIIYQSIETYFNNVIPKYITSFLNAKIKGQLFLGVDDFGEITGIPFVGNINKNIIINMFHQCLSNYISNITHIEEYVELKILTLSINTDLLNHNKLNLLWDNYQFNLKRKNDEYKTYYKNRQNWFKKIALYEKKIVSLLNSQPSRNELCEYINMFCVDEDVKQKLCNTLKSNQKICINNMSRDDEKNIFFWTCNFKDYVLSSFLKYRPSKPNIPVRIYPNLIFSRITPLRLKFIENNDNMNFYVFKIDITKICEQIVYFKFPYSEQCHYKIRRVTNNNNPFCASY